MKAQRIAVALTLLNLALLAYQALPGGTVGTAVDGSVLRGTGIEITDDQGRLRAQLTLEPGDPTFMMPDGTIGYPETVIFRLITADGKPRVKLTTSEEASGLLLLGDTDTTQTLLEADRAESSLKLRNNETAQKILEP